MPAKAIAETYIAELADAEVCVMKARYKLGQSVRIEHQEQGPEIVAQVSAKLRAAGLRFDVSALRKLRRVVGVIRPDEFEELLRLRSSNGLLLNWSRIEAISRFRSRVQRTDAARRMLLVREAGFRPEPKATAC